MSAGYNTPPGDESLKEFPAIHDAPAADCYEFGPFHLDLRRRQLLRGDEVLALTPKAFDLLQVLVTHADRVVEKDELMRRIWPDSYVGEDSLTQNVAVLRKVLGDASDSPRYVATIHKHGTASLRPSRVARSGSSGPRRRRGGACRTRGRAERLREERRVGFTRAGRLGVEGVLLMTAAAAGLRSGRRHRSGAAKAAWSGAMRFAVAAPENDARLGRFPRSRQPHVAFIADPRPFAPDPFPRVGGRAPAPGTDGAPAFWSPDGRAVDFCCELKMVNLAGGPPQTLAVMSSTNNAAAERQGVVRRGRALGAQVGVGSGGPSASVTTLDAAAQETGHQWPQFLPGGRRFLYGVRSANPDRNGIYVGSLDSTEKIRVLALPASRATYAGGYLVFAQDRALAARSFDPKTLRVGATQQIIASDIAAAGFAPPNEVF